MRLVTKNANAIQLEGILRPSPDIASGERTRDDRTRIIPNIFKIKLKPMIITWIGHSCFKIQDKIGPDGVTVVTDPFDKTIGLKPPSF